MEHVLSLLTLHIFKFFTVRQGEVKLIERMGKFRKVAYPGLNTILSLWGMFDKIAAFELSEIVADEPKKVRIIKRYNQTSLSMKEIVDDYPAETVISKDNAQIDIDAVVYYHIYDPEKAVYRVRDYVAALQKLVQSALRDECGKYTVDELLSNRDVINQSLRRALDEATDAWGLKVSRVEIKDIELGHFAQVMAEQRKEEIERRKAVIAAEGEKRAKILQSEGEKERAINEAEAKKIAVVKEAEALKEKQILEAEAEKQKRILEAEGLKQALILEAQGRAEKTILEGRAIAEAEFAKLSAIMKSKPSRELIALEYARAFEKIASGQNKIIYMPLETSGILSAISGVRDLLIGESMNGKGE